MSLYARLLVRHSCAVLVVVTIVSLLCCVLPLALHTLPTFTDPTIGFETRGTTLAHRFIAWENLFDESRPSRSLAANPGEIRDQMRMNRTYNRTNPNINNKKNKTKHRRKHDKNKTSDNKLNKWAKDTERRKTWSEDHIHFGYGVNVTRENEKRRKEKNSIRKQWASLKKLNKSSFIAQEDGPLFCGSPTTDYAHFVISTCDGSSLLTYENILSMCELQTIVRKFDAENYQQFCQRSSYNKKSPCCPLWSIPNYITLLANKTSCFNITPDDVKKTKNLLKLCAPYFHSMHLTSSCSEYEHCRAPPVCSQHDAIYNMLFYLIDSKAFSPENGTNDRVQNSMIFLPLASSGTILPLYMNLEKFNMTYKSLKISAMDFGLKNALFDVLIIRDTWLVGLGGTFVFLCAWVYSGSLMLTVMLFIAIAFSLGISYCFYIYVLNLEFFPFMNLFVAVIIIGIGADDAFIYIKVWTLVKAQLVSNDEENVCQFKNILSSGETLMIEIVNETLKHSILTMLVTTLTTAVAFFASFISYIPAINCFSVFAGTAVVVNFVLMITWLPATVFLLDSKVYLIVNPKWDTITKPMKQAFKDTQVILDRFIIYTIERLHLIIIVILGGIGICSVIIVFYYPGLRLPDSRQFQLFHTSHLFEQYSLKYKDKFIFERFNREWGTGATMPLHWVWGVKAIDNGNHMNPSSTGNIEFDHSFNISDPESQIWLLKFCAKLKSQSFYLPTVGPLLPNCFIESLTNWMERKCVDEVDKKDRTPCCESSKFPYPVDVFDLCIAQAVEALYQTPREFFVPGVAGPKFLRNSTHPRVAALVVEFESNVPYSMSYSVMNKFYNEVENWTRSELESAPSGMKSGWFISDLQFYDLQGTLASGTVIALILSSTLGFLVLLPATRSFVVSICAVSSVAFSVTVTIAILVAMGWKLNVLESVAISTSAGLAVDFNLHYALSFSNSMGSKNSRVLSALNSSLGPTAAAALTTGFAGIFLLCSEILPYSQIGTFLALTMLVSWSYSTWFLCSMLYVFGSNNIKDGIDNRRTISRVSSICSGVPNLESHELEHFGESNQTTVNLPQSPSGMSATTVVLHEELVSLEPSREEN